MVRLIELYRSPGVLLANALANQFAGEQNKSKVEIFYMQPFRNMPPGP